MRKLTSFYRTERERGITISVVMHLFFLLSIVVGVPELLAPPPPEPVVITVDLLPVTGITNVKPMDAKKPKPDPKPEETPKPPTKEVQKPTPPIKTEEPKPEEKKEEPKPEEKKPEPEPLPEPEKKEESKPEEKKPEPKKEKKEKKKEEKKKAKEMDLDAVLKAVKDTAKKEQKYEKAEKKKEDEKSDKQDKEDKASKNNSKTYDDSLPMSLSEKDAIMSQIAKYWNVPAGAKDAHELIVVLNVEVRQDGEVLKVELANQSKARYSQDPFFRAAADSAIRAVKMASPLKNLPPEKYQTWREMELNFNPAEMLY